MRNPSKGKQSCDPSEKNNFMIKKVEELAKEISTEFNSSERIYVENDCKSVKVPMREIKLSPTTKTDGTVEHNEPVRVYDTSGSWGDKDFEGDYAEGLPRLRMSWIKSREDTEEISGRDIKPSDNGYLSDIHDRKISEQKNELRQKKLTPVEKDRIKVLLISFLMIIIFWGAFEQAGGLMNLYAKQKTDRILLGFEIPASWFQSLNAFFIITLAVVVGGIWMKIKSKGKEASAIFKIAVGILIMGFGFLFMRFAASEYELMGYSSMHWLVLAYLFHTVGELCASPVSLSYITKLAPEKYAALMMGLYFAASGLGNKLAANIGENAGATGEKATFTGIFIFCTLFAILVIALLKPLKRLAHGAEDLNLKAV